MDDMQPAEQRRAYLSTIEDRQTGQIYLTCPRACGNAMTGVKDEHLVRWSCPCGYVIHS